MCKARKKDISKINDKVLKHITRYSTTITTEEKQVENSKEGNIGGVFEVHDVPRTWCRFK